jgi:hypothetical protein
MGSWGWLSCLMYALTPQHAASINTGMLTDIFYSSSTSPDAVLRDGGAGTSLP